MFEEDELAKPDLVLSYPVITMFLGMDLPALNLPDPWDIYLMTGFVIWHVGTDVLLEIHGYCLIRRGTNNVA